MTIPGQDRLQRRLQLLKDKLYFTYRRAQSNGIVEALAPVAPEAGSFCILPFQHMQINAAGAPRVCCMVADPLVIDGKPASVYQHTLEEIWNSEQMRTIRRDMVEGRPVEACRVCTQEERDGAVSRRMRENRIFASGGYNDDFISLRSIQERAKGLRYRVTSTPVNYHFDVGSRCNLKCRMCYSFASTRIRKDPVHHAWTDGGELPPEWTRFADDKPWHEQFDFIEREILRDPERVRMLSFYGGEPFIIPEIGVFLERLVERGVSENVEFLVSTNGTTSHAKWLHLVPRFRRFILSFSVDGFGPHYEYIRYPARWDTLTKNMTELRKLPKTVFSVNVTFQAYNALNVVELLQYLDSIQMRYNLNTLHQPPYLAPTVLPPAIRRLSAARLRAYAASTCPPAQRPDVLGLATLVDAPHGDGLEGCDPKLLHDFMVYTNDLDVSRGQSFARTNAETLALLQQAGLSWTSDLRYAQPIAANKPILPDVPASSLVRPTDAALSP